MHDRRRTTFAVPGCRVPLEIARGADGRLLTIAGGGRVYVDARDPGATLYDGEFARVEQVELPGGFLRRLTTLRESWTETYRWNAKGQLSEVDGVHVEYDAEERVVACRGPAGTWRYAYSGPHLAAIATPRALRRIVREGAGRPVAWSEEGRAVRLDYDAQGRRVPRRRDPPGWRRDATGRLWTIVAPDGRVLVTYLWDERHCLAAIAGEPGDPLAAVFSLDPTGTPVRVITATGARTIPRDAFGEALIDLSRASDDIPVPGLFGGAVLAGLVHLPYRRLDPRCGAFDEPDPFDGEARDPRRAAGWDGPLAIELPAAGPYTVCRNNPISLADPTGAISDLWWAIPSALTWSLQNTIASLLGMWLGIDFSPIGLILTAIMGGNPLDLEWVGGTNFDMFALRTDGWMSQKFNAPNAFTFQFFMSQQGPPYRSLDDARLFAPGDVFRPTLYGSLLHFVPANGKDFVTRGQRGAVNGTTLPDWSRCGGDAEAPFPGSQVPVFPKGGLHFNTIQPGVTQQTGDAIEIVPGSITLFGTLGTSFVLSAATTGLGLAINDVVLLTDSAGVAEIARVLAVHEASGSTSLTIDTSGTRLTTPPIHLDGLTGPAGTESLNPIDGHTSLLSIKASSNDYHKDVTALRLNRSGAPVHYATVTGFEASLTLDAALPATLGNSLTVRPATATGNFGGKIKSPTSFQVVNGGPVGSGTGVTVGPAATAIPCFVTDVTGDLVTVDRDISSLGAVNAAIRWRPLAPSAPVGKRSDAPETTATLTYAPDAAGTAPTTPFAWVDGSTTAVRRIVSVDYDALVMSKARPDTDLSAYSVDRFALRAPSAGGFTGSLAQAVALNAPPPADVRAYEVIQYTSPTVTAGGDVVTGAAVSGTTATTSVDPTKAAPSLTASQVLIAKPASGPLQPVTVRRLRLGVTFDRDLSALSADNLEAARLAPDSIVYDGVRRGDRKIRVRPFTGGTRIDFARLVKGELVSISFTTATASGTQKRVARVDDFSGATITYSNDEKTLPADATNVTVTRLVVIDPGTGSSRVGREGKRTAASQIEFSAWNAGAFPESRTIAIIDGATVVAAVVTSAVQPLTVELAAGTLAGPLTLAAAPNRATSGVSLRFSADGATVTFTDAPLGATPGNGFVVAVPYVDGTARVSGRFHNGTVRVPDDHENTALELDRRKSVTDHELTHTKQALRLGPLLLSYIPISLFECLSDFATVNGPTMSNYIPGTLAGEVLKVPSSGGVTVLANDDVQVAQNGRAAAITVGVATADSGFALGGAAREALSGRNIVDGPVMVRRSTQSGTLADVNKVFRIISNIGQFLTLGFVMNLLTVLGWAGLVNLIVQLVSWARSSSPHGASATLGDDKKTLTLAAGTTLDGVSSTSSVAVKGGNDTFIRPVASVDGATIVLAQAVPLSGTVEVTVYTPGAGMFGGARNYFPATVPDTSKPAVMKVSKVGNDTLTLASRDRVEIRTPSGSTFQTLVTTVAGDLVTVEQAALLQDAQPNEFLVAKVRTEDAHWMEDFLLDTVRMGWMNYVNDPYAQLTRRFAPESLGGRIATSSLRYLLGTHSWLLSPVGYFWFDNAFRTRAPSPNPTAQRSNMEQEASHASGDTYSPIGSLHGTVAVVGDVGRYWLTVNGGSRYGSNGGQPGGTPQDLVSFGQQDAPGVSFLQAPTLTGTTAFSVPRDFYQLSGGNFGGIGPRGFVPTSALLERTVGVHVALCKPPASPTSVTVAAQAAGSGVTGSDISAAADAQTAGVANISFPLGLSDVAVTIATLPVAENDTVSLVPFQRATLAVTPNGARVYRATPAEPGFVVDVSGADLVATAAIDTDDVEISRFHKFNAGSNSYDSGIGPIHLGGDLDIAVRRIAVKTVTTLPFRAPADPPGGRPPGAPLAGDPPADATAPALPSAKAGDQVYVLVPAQIAPVPFTTSVTGTPSPITPTIANQAPTAALAPFVRDGGVLSVTFPADQPPEAVASVTISIHVGPDAASSVAVTATIELDPHFTLDVVGGGAASVARGSSIVLASSGGIALAADPAPAGITLTAAADKLTVAVDAGFVGAQAVILAHDASNDARKARRTLTVT